MILTSLIIPLLSTSQSQPDSDAAHLLSEDDNYLESGQPKKDDSHAFRCAGIASSGLGTAITLLQLLLAQLWQDKLLDCHYALILIPAWISLTPLVILAVCSTFCSGTILDLLPTLDTLFTLPTQSNEHQRPLTPVEALVEAEKNSTIPISDAVFNFLHGNEVLSSSPSTPSSSITASLLH